VNGTLAVARYTLLELTRRRILLVFFIIGVLGIAAIGIGLKVFSSAFSGSVSFGGPAGSAPDPAKINRFLELMFITNLIGALAFFALLIAFAIGMTAIYHDLDSGAAVAIFSKPVSRMAFTAGKIAAAIVAMIAIVGVLSIEATLVGLLFGGGLEQTLSVETVAQVGNALTIMLIVLALSTWMNNIIAAVVAFIYNAVSGIVVGLHGQMAAGNLGDNVFLKDGLNVLYWLVPHQLVSDAQQQLARAEFDLFSSQNVVGPDGQGGPTLAQALAGVPGPSGAADIIWWVFLVALFASLVYLAVRRRQV
jgi:ABC-type transport system involved in multi-copper enzyme maturation permease subunit